MDDAGVIRAIGRVRSGDRRHDVGDSVLVPAATDLHVHFRDPPGSADVESIASGTLQAALGGVGLVGEMPNTEPAVSTAEALEAKAARVEGRAAVDVVLYGTPTETRALPALAERAGAMKIYLSPTTQVEWAPDGSELGPLLRRLAATGLPVAVHAEAPELFGSEGTAADPAGWNRARPPRAEESAIDRLLAAAPPGLRLHVAHVTTPAGLERLVSAGVSFEATPHHLLLTERSGSDARFKVNPPLRDAASRDGLWEAFRRGQVPCVASDHAPHAPDAKRRRFADAPSGVPGVETLLPILLAEVRRGSLALDVLQRAACDRPARWFGQPTGRLAVGHRANFLVVDFRQRRTLRADGLHGPSGGTPFEGREAIFPVEHWRDGERIVAGGEYVGRPNGRVVRPEFLAPARALSPSGG